LGIGSPDLPISPAIINALTKAGYAMRAESELSESSEFVIISMSAIISCTAEIMARIG
jgi:hypothetical protein